MIKFEIILRHIDTQTKNITDSFPSDIQEPSKEEANGIIFSSHEDCGNIMW